MRLSLLLEALPVVAACASAPGAQPHDMSAAGHQAAAKEQDRIADGHAARYDAAATTEAAQCPGLSALGGACWTSTINTTREHLDEAEEHRQMASDHRVASRALRDTEAQSCAGISDADRNMSPFEHRADIARVEQLNAPLGSGKQGPSNRMAGALVTFRVVPGLTAQWLQRVVDCHIARNAALGHDVPEMPSCPLVPNGVVAKVIATDSGLAVAVRSDDSATAQEVWRRASLLASH